MMQKEPNVLQYIFCSFILNSLFTLEKESKCIETVVKIAAGSSLFIMMQTIQQIIISPVHRVDTHSITSQMT